MIQATTHSTKLLREGHKASAGGNRQQALALWRRAATLSPHDEQVWMALLEVVDNDSDRQGCLQIIVAINPNNTQAKQYLKRVNARLIWPLSEHRPDISRRGAEYPLWRVVVWWLEAIALGALLAVAFALALYVL